MLFGPVRRFQDGRSGLAPVAVVIPVGFVLDPLPGFVVHVSVVVHGHIVADAVSAGESQRCNSSDYSPMAELLATVEP